MALGLNWAKHSRLKRADGKEEPYMGEKKEFLVRFAKQYMQSHKDIDYFMFGHRHIELDLMLSKKTRLMILGDWIWQFTYAVFDGEHMFMEEYVEGESNHNIFKQEMLGGQVCYLPPSISYYNTYNIRCIRLP